MVDEKQKYAYNLAVFMEIFKQINSDKYTDNEKAHAIYHILKMPTHNSIKKDDMLAVIKYLFDKTYEVSEEGEQNE